MTLDSLRKRIDALDHEILAKMAERLALCKETVQWKEDVEDTDRESALRELWAKEAQSLGLSASFAMTLLEALLAESKRLQRHK
ncbi:MAG: chorismate mutase [Candidatus Peribacteraceae bacterium]|jgi:chorismate mutase